MFRRSGQEVCLLRHTVRPRIFPGALQEPLRRQSSKSRRRQDAVKSSGFVGLTPSELDTQLELHNVADVLRRVFLGPQAVYRSRSINQRMYDFHFKTPDKLKEYLEKRYRNATQAQGEKQELLGPRYYRLQELPTTLSMELVRSQFRSCLAPEDFTVVFSVVMQHEMGPKILANPSLQRLLQKWVVDRLEPGRVLEFLSIYITRLEAVGLTCDIGIIWSALVAAAQTHCTTAVRKYLKMWRTRNDELGQTMDREAFMGLLRALQAGYDHPSLGRTRNHAAMLEIMFGFSDPAYRGPYHLKEYLREDDWAAIMLWTETLVKMKAGEHVWETWKLVRKRSLFHWHKMVEQLSLTGKEAQRKAYPPRFFIQCLFQLGKPERAWQVFRRGGRDINGRDYEIWDSLLEHIHLMGNELDPDLKKLTEQKLLEKLTFELKQLETRLGIEWKPAPNPRAKGYHILVQPPDDVESNFELLFGENEPIEEAASEAFIKKVKFEGKIFHNPGKALSRRQRKELERAANASQVSDLEAGAG